MGGRLRAHPLARLRQDPSVRLHCRQTVEQRVAVLQRELVDPDEIAREMTLLLHSEATQFAVFVRTKLAADIPRVMGDRVQLQQVPMNLMMNSIDAMKVVDGSRELIIQSQRGEDGQVLISVSDTGVGFHRSRRTRSLMRSLPPRLTARHGPADQTLHR